MSLWRRHGTGPLVVALVATTARRATAIVFPFKDAPPPPTLGLGACYRFCVYSMADAPSSENGNAAVFVKLSLAVDSVAQVPAPSSTSLPYNNSVYLAVVHHTVMEQLVHSGNICDELSPSSQIVAMFRRNPAAGTEPVQLSSNLTSFTGQLTRSGIYTLLVANCGQLTGFRIEGTVSVRNPHGFLQATEYSHLKFYQSLTAFYGLLWISWLVMSLRWWQQLRNAQKVILGVAFLAMLECGMMGCLYYLCNTRNEFNDVVYLAASLVSASKVCELFRIAIRALLLTKSSGATADEKQGRRMDLCLSTILAIFMAADLNFREVLRLRACYGLSQQEVLRNSSPVILMGTGIFGWSHMALGAQWMRSGQEQKGTDSSLVRRSHVVLALASAGALAATLAQLLDPSVGADSAAWSQHVFASDGAHHAVFALVLLLLMWVWMPSQSTLGYEYQPQGQDMDGQPIGAIWNDDALDEETLGGTKRE